LLTKTVEGALSAATVPAAALGSGAVPGLVKALLGPTRALRIAVAAALVAAGLGAFALFVGRDAPAWWTRGARSSSADLRVDLDPDLADRGVIFEELSRSAALESGLVTDRAEYRLVLRFRTTGAALDRDDLAYTLYDAAGRQVGHGPAPLSAPLAPGGSADCTLDDPRLLEARRLLLRPVR
jgi:hypothetical protein